MSKKNAIPILIINSVILITALWVLVSRYQKFVKKDISPQVEQQQAAENKQPPEALQGEKQQPDKLRNILFQYKSSKVKTVAIIGNFNDWTPEPLIKTQNNTYQVVLKLRPGKYFYNYLVDGHVIPDPNNKKPAVESPRGFKSSVIELKEIKSH